MAMVLDENRRKMSKRLKNYPDPLEMFDTFGADALRWYLVSSPLLAGGDLAIPKDGRAIGEVRRQVLKPIWNAYYFFSLYANADGIRAELISQAEGVLDRYILAKTRELVLYVERRMDAYDIPGACAAVVRFLDVLNNWYIRRSRERFWRAGRDRDKLAAYNTLYTVLTTLLRTIAPLVPYLSETVYRGLSGETSVHLADWPDAKSLPAEPELVESMDIVREICSVALAIREQHNLRVRLPLSHMIVATPKAAALESFRYLIEDEVNVKRVEFDPDVRKFGTLELHVNPKIGARIGKALKEVLAAAKAGEWRHNPTARSRLRDRALGGGGLRSSPQRARRTVRTRLARARGGHSQCDANTRAQGGGARARPRAPHPDDAQGGRAPHLRPHRPRLGTPAGVCRSGRASPPLHLRGDARLGPCTLGRCQGRLQERAPARGQGGQDRGAPSRRAGLEII